MASKKTTLSLHKVYPRVYKIPTYARNLAYHYSSRMSSYDVPEIVYDTDYVYKQETLDPYISIDDLIMRLEQLRKLGCKSISNVYYDVPYEEGTSMQPVIEDYPHPRRDKDGKLTKIGADLEKVLEQKKKAAAIAKEEEKKRLAAEEKKALQLLKERGYKIQETLP